MFQQNQGAEVGRRGGWCSGDDLAANRKRDLRAACSCAAKEASCSAKRILDKVISFGLDPHNIFVSSEHHLQSYPLWSRSAQGDMQELLSPDKSHPLLSGILLQQAIYEG
jgi:hypothetical protein